MRNKVNVVNTIPPSADYPFGRLKDDTGINDGTPICEENNGDIQETVTFFMNRAKITPNGLPDNVSNGYQIADAVRETGGKFDVIYEATVGYNKIEVPFRLDNIYEGEFAIVRFNLTADKQNVSLVNTIVGTDNTEFTALVYPDQNNDFFNNSRCIVEKVGVNFRVYPIATMSVLENIYERLETLESNASNNMRIIHKGTYIHTDSSSSGIAVITHPVISLTGTRVIITCTRSNSSNSIVTTDFTYLMVDRSTNQFRVAFNNYPASTNLDPLRIDWWIVNN